MKVSESKYAQCLYFTTNALARKVEKLAVEAWKSVALSPSHAYLLMLVLEQPGLQPGTLSNQLQLSPSTVSRLLEKLEDKRLVVRITEGKMSNVYATQAAAGLQPELEKCIQAFNNACAGILGTDERNGMICSLIKLADKLG